MARPRGVRFRQPTPGADYPYICSNETIYGTRWSELPTNPNLVVDASSELLARPLDLSLVALLFGGHLPPFAFCSYLRAASFC